MYFITNRTIATRGMGFGALSILGILGSTSAGFAATSVNVDSTSSGTGALGCTLEEAVGAMNAGKSANGCTLNGTGAPRTVILSLTGTRTYNIANRLAPTVAMTIRGSGSRSMGTTFIQPTSGFSANAAVFHQVTSPTPFNVTLQDLTIRRTSGSASVTGVRVENFWDPINRNAGPTMTLNRVRISGFNNSGLYSNYGNIDMYDSIIENNSTTGDGGGIRHHAPAADSNRSLRVFRSLIRSNDAFAGGGVYFYAGGNSRFEQTTIAQNSAHSGGGLFSQMSSTGYLELQYATVAENDAFSGGGIYCNDCEFRTFTYFSIIAYNTAAQGFDIDGDLSSSECIWSTIDSLDESTHDERDLLNRDPMLGDIKDLGGNLADLNGDGVIDGMLGYQPLKGSPALDYLTPQPTAHPRDQRGFLRGQDRAGNGPGMDDVGAIEQGPWEAERISQFQLSGGTHIVIPTSGSDNNLSDGKAMRFRGTANGQFVTYRMPISEAGSYALDVKVRRGPSGARARLEWSPNGSTGWTDVSGTQEFYALSTTEEHFYLTANLSPIGQVYFRWVITGQHPSSTNRDVVTDYISLIKE